LKNGGENVEKLLRRLFIEKLVYVSSQKKQTLLIEKRLKLIKKERHSP
jgi:hypothetical protein